MSGEICIEVNKIFWRCKDEIVVEIFFDDIFMIGEYTVDSIFDDWFIVFVAKDGSWEGISMFAENLNELRIVLADKFDSEIGQAQLANSSKWNSIISYPKSLRGKKLFKLTGNQIELEKEAKEFIQIKSLKTDH